MSHLRREADLKDIFWTGDFLANLVAELLGAVVIASVVAALIHAMERRRSARRDLLAWGQAVRILEGFFAKVLGRKRTASFFSGGNEDDAAMWRASHGALASGAIAWADGQMQPSVSLLRRICVAAKDVFQQLRNHVQLFREPLLDDGVWAEYYLQLDAWIRTLRDPALMRPSQRSARLRRDDIRTTVYYFARAYSQAASNMHKLIEYRAERGRLYARFPPRFSVLKLLASPAGGTLGVLRRRFRR